MNREQTEHESDEGILQRLRKLIGRDCLHLGRSCRLLEILAEDGVLILEVREQLPPIQTDQYGRAAYRSNELMQVPIFAADGTSFSDDMMDLFASLPPRVQTKLPNAD